jgi:hypothetical protein
MMCDDFPEAPPRRFFSQPDVPPILNMLFDYVPERIGSARSHEDRYDTFAYDDAGIPRVLYVFSSGSLDFDERVDLIVVFFRAVITSLICRDGTLFPLLCWNVRVAASGAWELLALSPVPSGRTLKERPGHAAGQRLALYAVARALACLHDANIIHRAVGAGSVVYDAEGLPRLGNLESVTSLAFPNHSEWSGENPGPEVAVPGGLYQLTGREHEVRDFGRLAYWVVTGTKKDWDPHLAKWFDDNIPGLSELFNAIPKLRMTMKQVLGVLDACAWGDETEFWDGREAFGPFVPPEAVPDYKALSHCMELSEDRSQVQEAASDIITDPRKPFEEIAGVLAVIHGATWNQPFRELAVAIRNCLEEQRTLARDVVLAHLDAAREA